jgi:glutamate-5-semialdehyde dehydrogenase
MENNDIKKDIIARAMAAKHASRKLASLDTAAKNRILIAMAEALVSRKGEILFQNEIDVDAAKDSELDAALIDRLTLNDKRIIEMAQGLRDVVALNDPVGEVVEDWTPPIGVHIQKVRVPIGVIGMIYESRPNVTVDAAGLCIKSGNAIILRGGSEAINTNHILIKIISAAGQAAGLPDGALQFVETTDRQAIMDMIKLYQYIDLIIPRGGEQMIRSIRENATVPVLSHGKGLCHTYIDKEADLEMAKKIAFNAKCQRPGVCNAMETLLVHKDVADKFLPPMCKIYKDGGVEVRGCPETKKIVPGVEPAKEADWSEEYHAMILSIKVVNSLEDAINHINKYGSGHSEAIVTANEETAAKFVKEIDAAAVFHNASTRLHDGGVFGFGAEIGISTQKLHARGPMGLKELTTTKYIVYGHGEIRE